MYISDALSRLPFTEYHKEDEVIPLTFLKHSVNTILERIANEQKLKLEKAQKQQPQLQTKGATINSHPTAQRKMPDRKAKNKPVDRFQSQMVNKDYCKTSGANHNRESKSNLPQVKLHRCDSNTQRKETNKLPNKDHMQAGQMFSMIGPDEAKQLEGTCTVPKYLLTDKAPIIPEQAEISILRRHIPQQKEIDILLKDFRKRHIKEWNLPLTAQEIAKQYPQSPRFRDIYCYIMANTLPSNYQAHKRLQMEATNYVVINDLLFRLPRTILHSKADIQLQLAIPETYETAIFHLYHNEAVSGHLGLKQTLSTLARNFYIVNLAAKLQRYLQACDTCQRTGRKPAQEAPMQARIPLEYTPFGGISCDIKYMPKGMSGYKFLLIATCELTNYTVAIPLQERTADAISQALWVRIFCIFTIPKKLIVDQDSAFTARVIQALITMYKIDLKVISPYNHGSLKTERQIQTIQTIITKCLTNKGENWPLFAANAAKVMNTFDSDALAGYSPHELVFLRKPENLLNLSQQGLQLVERE